MMLLLRSRLGGGGLLLPLGLRLVAGVGFCTQLVVWSGL